MDRRSGGGLQEFGSAYERRHAELTPLHFAKLIVF
jgi:hypothetical protein